MANVHPLRALALAVFRAPNLLRVRPRAAAFLARYLVEFPILRVGGSTILHSHLPPLDSPAYARFVRMHLVERVAAPSHAQVAVTSACPQRCDICYNRDRTGRPLDAGEVGRAIEELISAGAVWMGLTGGEPLLLRELPELVAIGRGRAAMKLFTTGIGATPELASALAAAGLFSVSVSLDAAGEEANDRGRNYPGAWRAALRAVEIFLAVPGMHVGISAVLSRSAIRDSQEVDRLLARAGSLGVHELWLSEAKPAVASLWHRDLVLTEDERKKVARYQDEWNRRARRAGSGVVLNYLGHFEGAEHFGCNAGRKMIYVDAFGEVSPCVFAPMSFGNVRDRSLAEIIATLQGAFPTEDRCFVNRNWPSMHRESRGVLPMGREKSLALIDGVAFRPMSEFNRRLHGGARGSRGAG
ncbi:MAG: radical SAM/SPASM domain-containing protein [Vicinamibacterales bacterium]